ncbi:NUDIX hydrolase [Paratissierella segnis]|uniref:CoA pyrophosphatase n=1 Tax=Paratissierella segnis TaxID=2763679 RepID=A0A926ETE3_9FIRM|nr:CoA pyrophosphatase [Paratissierella segnis]MBC8587903.1 CoA pyrophosphatase [Paratissierella segnis]
MDINMLIDKVKSRSPQPIDIDKKYAILIPLIKVNDEWELLYELRAKSLESQPGEISFPGGKVELDEAFMDAAIRETIEELKICRENIDYIGELDYLISYSNITIHCFLAIISGIIVDEIQPNHDEVDHIFTVPVNFFLENEPDKYYLDLVTVDNDEFPYNLIPDGRKYKWRRGVNSVLFYKYKEYIIWGYTAKMTKQLIDIIK